MDEQERLAVVTACTHVVMAYARAVDSHDWDALVAIWAEDCTWTRPGTAPIVGRAAARAYFENLEAERKATNPHGILQRHMVTTVHVEPIDADSADASWYATVMSDPDWAGELPRPMRQPFLVVEYRTSFRRVEGQWQIARHHATHVFREGVEG